MKEINRHILRDAISDLPLHNVPVSLWDEVESGLVNLPINKMPVHIAPESAWAGIEKGLSSGNITTNRIVRYASVALLLLSGLFIGNNYMQRSDDKLIDASNIDNALYNKAGSNKSNMAIITEKEDTPQQTIIIVDEVNNEPKFTELIQPVLISESDENEVTNFDFSNNSGLQKKHTAIYTNKLFPKKCTSLLAKEDVQINLNSNNSKSEIPNFDYCDFNRVENSIHLGILPVYQLFIINDDVPDTKIQYWAGGDIRTRFTRNRLWFEAGIGFSASSDKSTFAYDYKTNEMVDTYEYVDSIHFDPITGQTEYFTTTVEVWDSVQYNSTAFLKQNYIYANIPLKFGYIFYDKRSLCMDISLGGNYYFEVSRKSEVPNLFHESSTIGNVDNVSVGRRSQFYNFEVGMGINWNLNRSMTLRFEPNLNYYPMGIYKNIDKQSVSLNIRAGLYFNF